MPSASNRSFKQSNQTLYVTLSGRLQLPLQLQIQVQTWTQSQGKEKCIRKALDSPLDHRTHTTERSGGYRGFKAPNGGIRPRKRERERPTAATASAERSATRRERARNLFSETSCTSCAALLASIRSDGPTICSPQQQAIISLANATLIAITAEQSRAELRREQSHPSIRRCCAAFSSEKWKRVDLRFAICDLPSAVYGRLSAVIYCTLIASRSPLHSHPSSGSRNVSEKRESFAQKNKKKRKQQKKPKKKNKN